MKICFISSDYPEKGRPVFPFVKNLVDALADRGHECIVVAPFSITHNKRICKFREVYKTLKGNVVTVLRPNHFSFSNFAIAGWRPSSYFRYRAVQRALKKLDFKPDVIYGHFWGMAYEGYAYASANNIPLVVATGESVIPQLNVKNLRDFCKYVSGVICVSSKNKQESIDKGLTTEDKCIVIPNAINNATFKLLDRQKCRQQLNIPDGAFVVISVGSFIMRKGINRVAEAINGLGKEIYSIFIGSGPEQPVCDKILYCGRVDNIDIPIYLNAADVFVLPTLKEGCCNAIVEAMACGLPIISSDLSFNHDILDKSNSILIDPMNIEEIKTAILKLYNDAELKNKLANASYENSKLLTINVRAKRIEEFIEHRSTQIEWI